MFLVTYLDKNDCGKNFLNIPSIYTAYILEQQWQLSLSNGCRTWNSLFDESNQKVRDLEGPIVDEYVADDTRDGKFCKDE